MEKLIRPSGNYRKLLSYQKTEVIYEMTYYFCQKYLQKGDRTVDQMVQAARSGKQNIMELCASRPPETIANMAIILIHQADFLLHRQLERLEQDFADNGGFSERMMRVRKEKRGY